MPPRLTQLRSSCVLNHSPISSFSLILVPFVQSQQRFASILSDLRDTEGAYNKRIRVGRGPSSGKGKTSGRGHKGQKQHGKVPSGMTGGQTPLHIVKGIRGFDNPFPAELSKLNVDRLQSWVDQGRLNPKKPISLKELCESRCIHGVKKHGVKLLGRNATELKTPLNIIVSRASKTAIAAIEAAGGSITTRYYTPVSVQRILRGESDPHTITPADFSGTSVAEGETKPRFKYRVPDPTSRKDIEYYRDPEHRGYLRGQVKEGESPSLFFKLPRVSGEQQTKVKKAVAKIDGTLNRIW